MCCISSTLLPLKPMLEPNFKYHGTLFRKNFLRSHLFIQACKYADFPHTSEKKEGIIQKKKSILNAAHSSVLDTQFLTESQNHVSCKRSMRSLSQSLTSHHPINPTMTLSVTDSLFLNTSMAVTPPLLWSVHFKLTNPLHENNS